MGLKRREVILEALSEILPVERHPIHLICDGQVRSVHGQTSIDRRMGRHKVGWRGVEGNGVTVGELLGKGRIQVVPKMGGVCHMPFGVQ